MEYSEQILLQAAQKLWNEATGIIAATATLFTLVAFFAGLIGTSALFLLSKTDINGGVLFCAIVCAAVGLAIGIWEGKRRAFELRVKAQQIFVLVQIEHNTRNVRT
jgi:hypothetical protein